MIADGDLGQSLPVTALQEGLNFHLESMWLLQARAVAGNRAANIVNMRRRVLVPEPVLISLAKFFGEGVERVEVFENSFFARLHWHALATTRRRRIYLRGSAEDFFKDPALMMHEYFHVMKQWEPLLLTSGRYVLEWLRLRSGYFEQSV